MCWNRSRNHYTWRAIPGFQILGPPRTKKNSGRIITIPQKGSRACPACGHRPGFPKLLPSEAHEEWFFAAMDQCVRIKAELGRRGVALPVAGLLSVEALVYREANQGDVCGFLQAIGDLLERSGIIQNDRQIEDWDGSRRLIDREKPRIEIYLTVIKEVRIQQPLPMEENAT